MENLTDKYSRVLLKFSFNLVLFASMITLFSGCFTGIEGTKKIKLSKEDMRASVVSDEDNLLSSVSSEKLKDWKTGKPFLVADNKASLVFEREVVTDDDISGETFYYDGLEQKQSLDGSLTTVIVFKNDKNEKFRYFTSKDNSKALETITSSEIPFLIDIDRVSQIKNILVGKKLWTVTSLWYDSDGNNVNGQKFVPVRIEDVKPGGSVFPVLISFSNQSDSNNIDSPTQNYMYMNYGGDDGGSRKFKNLFTLKDPKSIYKNISDSNWKLIQQGKVVPGMTKEECRISIGSPSDVDKGHTHSTLLDVWKYSDGRVLRFADGILVDVWR